MNICGVVQELYRQSEPRMSSVFLEYIMKSKKIISSFLLILISVAWGGSFVAQSKGGDLVGPFTFGFFRFLVAGIAILPIVAFLDSREKKSDKPKPDYSTKELIRDGFVCGFFLAGTSAFQQLGLFAGTPSGKAGFLTSCNVIFVPIICLFFKDKIKWNVWLSIVVTVCGLYLLCVNDGFGVQMSDVLVLICSVMNAARIIAVDRFKHKTDIIKLACVQFFSASLFLTVPMAISEMRDFSQWCTSINQSALWMSLLYAGVIAGTFAFTVQNVAQKYVDPTVSSLLMSTESVFAVLAGWLIMGDKLTVKELIGCAIIFVALVIAQLPNKKKTESID